MRFRSKGGGKVLKLTAQRKKNRGENLKSWRKKQKELAAQRAAGLLNDAPQEAAHSGQDTSENTSITGEISSVPQDINTSQVHSGGLLVQDQFEIEGENSVERPLLSAAGEISSTTAQTSSKQLIVSLQKIENINEILTNSNVSQDINSSQVSISSAIENSSTAQIASNNAQESSSAEQNPDSIQQTYTAQPYSEHNYISQTQLYNQETSNKHSSASITNNSILKSTKSTIENSSAKEKVSNNAQNSPCIDQNLDSKQQSPQNINSSQIPVSSASVKDNCVLAVVKNAAESSSTDSATSSNNIPPSVSATDSDTLPVISDSGSDFLSKNASSDCYSSLVYSSASCDSNTCLLNSKDLQQRVLRSHRSAASSNKNTGPLKVNQSTVATQINYYTFKVPKKAGSRKIKKLQPLPKEAQVHGRRIIDFEYFFRALKFVNNHSKGKNNFSRSKCDLNNIMITKEAKSGISTRFYLKCAVCHYKKVLWSESPSSAKKDVTADFVSGILKIKCNFEDASTLLSEMHLPSLSYAYFVEEFVKVYKSNKDIDKANQGLSENLTENIEREPQLVAGEQSSSASNNNSLLEQVNSGGLIVEDQFEIKQENSVENENESETINLDQRATTSDSELTTCQESPILNAITIKQEVNSDDEDLTNSIINNIPNKESVVENAKKIIFEKVPSSQNEASVCENRMVVNHEQVNLHKSKSFESDKDNSTLVKPEFVDMEITTKVSTPDLDNKQSESELPLKKKARIEIHQGLSNPSETQEVSTSKEITFYQSRFGSNGLASIPSTGVQNLPASFSRNMEDIAPVSSLITERGGNATFTPLQHMPQSNGNEALIALQNMASRSQGANGTSFPSGASSTAFQQHIGQSNSGTKGDSFLSGTSTAHQRHTGQSNSGVLPLINMHQSWSNNFNSPVNNPMILFSDRTPYMSGMPVSSQFPKPASNIVIPQPASSANSIMNVSGGRYMPLTSSGIQQPVNFSNCMPRVTSQASFQQPGVLSNAILKTNGSTYVPYIPSMYRQSVNQPTRPPVVTDRTRWIGRANMNSNDPSCTLPGGAPKGVSDTAPPKSHADQSSQQSKRPKFHCDDCDVSFAKPESWDSHNKFYCIKRLNLPPSSTVTNQSLMDIPLQSNSTTQSFKSHIGELLSAMAIKRSFLETSMKSALDAQYVINLHKSAQELTQKSFKELDNALNREKALMPEASLEEQQTLSEARAQALLRAEAAYKQEKHSAAVVEQALYRQKAAIEASLAATGHEQTALISTLKSLHLKEDQNVTPSVLQTKYNAYDQTSLEQEKLLGASPAQTVEQQDGDGISSKSVSAHENLLSRLNSLVQNIDEYGTT